MENINQQQKIKRSWIGEVAGARVAFKYHLASYLIMNVFFWLSWFSYGRGTEEHFTWMPWPLYPMLFGAVGLLFHFLAAYILPVKTNDANEYQTFK